MNAVTDIILRYRELLSEVDKWFSRCSLVAGPEMACQRGCSACCRGMFDITLMDAFLLHEGLTLLSATAKNVIAEKSIERLFFIRETWPDFDYPFLLNIYPENEYDLAMPDEDEIPCPLLENDGCCLVYENRPMTCRLHGVPLIDMDGEIMFDEWCSENFQFSDPLEREDLRYHFRDIFAQEQLLFREFTTRLFGRPFNEVDTLIPAVPFIDFSDPQLPERLLLKS